MCVKTRAKNNDRFLIASLFCFQSGQSRSEEEDETVDVESYGDETTVASSAMNLAASQNNNNITKNDSIRPTMRPMPFPGNNVGGGGIGIGGVSTNSSMPNDDHMITSRNSIWQTHTKHGHRLGTSPPVGMGATNLTLVNSHNSLPSINCGPPPPLPPPSSIFSSESTGATSTSNDQINDYDRTVDSPNRTMTTSDRLNAMRTMNDMQKNCSTRELKNNAETTHNSCDNDNDEEVIVTNDDDECQKKMPSTKDLKRSDKNR